MNKNRKEVIEKLLKEIYLGNIVSHGKLPPERLIAQSLGENRTIVREALIALEAMGVIDIRERQGIYLSSREENAIKTTLNKIRDWPADVLSRVMEVRQILEPAAAALSATRRNDEDVQKLRDCLTNMREVANDDSEEAHRAGAYWNTIYHTIIVSSTDNTYLARIYEGMMGMLEQSMYYMRSGTLSTDEGGRNVAIRDHSDLYEAIRKGDADEAEKIAEIHLHHTIKAMVALGQIVPSSDIYSHRFVGRMRHEKITN